MWSTLLVGVLIHAVSQPGDAVVSSAPEWTAVVITADDDEVTEVDLEELISVDYEEGKPLPDSVQKLDGKKVRLRAFMDPTTPEETPVFYVVSDSCGCGGKKLHHFVKVTLADEVTGYRPELLTLVGTLSVGEETEDGFVTSVYRLNDTVFE